MGGLFGGGSKRGSRSGNGSNRGPEYADDGSRPMPSYMNPAAIEAARERRLAMTAKSGRSSTNLSGTPGTRAYVNTFLGGTQ